MIGWTSTTMRVFSLASMTWPRLHTGAMQEIHKGSSIVSTFRGSDHFLTSGFFNSVANIHLFTALQKATAPEHRGKVFGLLNAISSSLQPVSQGLAGFFGDIVPAAVIFLISGTANMVGGELYAASPGIKDFLVNSPEQSTSVARMTAAQ